MDFVSASGTPMSKSWRILRTMMNLSKHLQWKAVEQSHMKTSSWVCHGDKKEDTIALSFPTSIRETAELTEPTITLFRLGGAQSAPHRFFPCCAETACSRLKKLTDF